MARNQKRIDHYRKRLKSLETERSPFIPLWRELSDYILGHRGRFLVTDGNKPKRNTKQHNNTAKMAARTLASGMMAGITSPARPWFQLGTLDPDLAEFGPAKIWLHDVEMKMREVFAQSNVYNQLHASYAELGTFGTAPMGVYFNRENIIRAKAYTAGSYMLATNGLDEVDTFFRKYRMTVGQVVKEFGKDNVSRSCLDNWNRGNTESWVNIIHCIEPNDDADMMSAKGTSMPYRSVYFEENQSEDKFLRVKGFEDFPIMAPRWDIAGDDIYATSCPGMDALGDNKALQLHEKRTSTAIDILVDPPKQAPIAMKNMISGSFLPGDLEFVPDTGNGIKSMYDFKPDLNAMASISARDEDRVNKAYYVDLFLMLANSDRRQITAREIEEKHEEKLLMLGPVLERLHNELLNPLIKRTFNLMMQAGVLPEPPSDLQDTALNVEYISVLAQAQKLTAINGLERLSTYAMNLAQVWPEARHKFDAMQSIDEYAQSVGVAPRVVKDDEAAEGAIAAERQQQQAAQMAELAPGMAQAAKSMADTDVESANALTRSMGLA